ncbi:MAG: mannose-6-phosphate isomerase, partial [Deltaproteobacteria bacterium]
MTAKSLPPMVFEPIIKPLPWGGRKLGELFGKPLPPDLPCGESWEVVDLPDDQSTVASGPVAGKTLRELMDERRDELLGPAKPLLGRFPVIFKLLDANQTLSVQVHPDAEAAARIGGGARPKTEAWYILQAEPGAVLYLGLNPGVTKEQFEKGIGQGKLEPLLRKVEVHAGDFVFLPAGTLHAIGAGIVLAEIQQASDTTYRVFDWNRLGLDGKPRQLHVGQALASVRLEYSGKPPHDSPASGRPGIRCPEFLYEKIELERAGNTAIGAGLPSIVCCIGGEGEVEGGGENVRLGPGTTCLVPASCEALLSSEAGGEFLH